MKTVTRPLRQAHLRSAAVNVKMETDENQFTRIFSRSCL